MLRYLNLTLLILYPVSWSAPLMRAGLLPLFGLSEISVLSGLKSLWHSDIFLALIVAVFAIIAPFVKTLGLSLIHFGFMPAKALRLFEVIGKLAMADIFLIALYIVIAKGTGVGTLQTAWGLYLFSFCVFASLTISRLTHRP